MALQTSGRRLVRNREGFALLLALGAIVVISALVAGAFMVSTRDVRTARVTANRESAQMRAENALFQLREQIRTQVDSPRVSQIGGSIEFRPANGQGRATLTRLSQNLYLATATATSGTGGSASDTARSRVSMLLVRNIPQMEFLGAMTVRGRTTVGGSSLVDGNDLNPPGWPCPPAGAAMPGVVSPPGSTVNYSDRNIDGNPDVLYDDRASDDATYFQYGNSGWNDLIALAKKIPGNMGPMWVAPSLDNGNCDTADLVNWGDPGRVGGACETYFPVVYVAGDAKINRLRGQGVLLVEGDLEIQGNFEFFGPVIVKGALDVQGTGNHINGAVMAANVNLDPNVWRGNAVVNYSSCAIATALRNSAVPVPVRRRAWADQY